MDIATLAFVGCIFATVAAGLLAARRGTTSSLDYLLAGRDHGAVVTSLSASATDVSGWVLMGLVGMAFSTGLGVLWVIPAGLLGYALNWVTPTLLNTWQYATWWGGWQDLLSMNKVADTRRYTACLGLYYTVGRTTIWLSAGWQMTQNPSSDVVGSWRHGQNVRYAMILAVPTRVNRHFSIAPEIGYYFYGYNPTEDVGGANPGSLARTSTQADLGSLWIIGIRFAFTF